MMPAGETLATPTSRPARRNQRKRASAWRGAPEERLAGEGLFERRSEVISGLPPRVACFFGKANSVRLVGNYTVNEDCGEKFIRCGADPIAGPKSSAVLP